MTCGEYCKLCEGKINGGADPTWRIISRGPQHSILTYAWADRTTSEIRVRSKMRSKTARILILKIDVMCR